MASAVESAGFGHEYSPQEILKEVRNFLHGANQKVQNQRQRESLAQSALILLRTLPTARHAVLEYLANMFDEAANNYLLEIDIGRSVTDASSASMNSLLHDACGVLHTFIQTHSVAWAPIISSLSIELLGHISSKYSDRRGVPHTGSLNELLQFNDRHFVLQWSLELLGHISSKYSDRRGVPHTGSLNELLQLWLTCKPTKLLIEVATECFAQMVSGAPESCVDSLLEASVKYSPHFDWVVAHIGSCFPRTIITRVLMCGLKDYCHHGKQGEMDETKIPKMGSVVNILGHLASKHGHDIRDALMKLFMDSISGLSESRCVTTLPFLLQLASMSPLLLHILATDMVKALTAPVLNQLYTQFQPWMKTYPQEFDSMMSLVIHLVIHSDTGADKALQFLLFNATATKDNTPEGTPLPVPDVQNTCSILMDRILKETRLVVFKYREASIDIPYLGALSNSLSTLSQQMLSSSDKRSQWLQKLICYIILYKGERFGAETLAFILSHAETKQQLGHFICIQQEVEVGLCRVLDAAIRLAVDMLHHQKETNQQLLLDNLLYLTEWESSSNLFVRSSFKQCLQPHWESLSKLLLHTDLQVAMVTLKLLNYIDVPSSISSGAVLSACGSLTNLVFRVIEIQDDKTVSQMFASCKHCVRVLSRRSYAQSILVRYFVEGAIANENKHLLGGKTDLGTATSGSRDSHTSLLAENQSHGLSLTTLRSHSSVFHAGVIGPGLRKVEEADATSEKMVERNIGFLLEMLWTCCQDTVSMATKTLSQSDEENKNGASCKSYKLVVSADLCRMIGNLIVEISTPDVLYNNRFWPEEESLKMTVERDLHVWKVFDDNPVLWKILLMLAGNTLIISRCSTVIKSLTATMIHHFESLRDKLSSDSPNQLQCVCNIVHCLGKSLPDKLSSNSPNQLQCVYNIVHCLGKSLRDKLSSDSPIQLQCVCNIVHCLGKSLRDKLSSDSPNQLQCVYNIVHCLGKSLGDKLSSDSPNQLQCICNIVHCLGKSGLLPPPMNILSELFPLISPFEAFQLLLTIWRYMKENPPTEDPSEVTRRACDERHTDIIRSICHKHIDRVGDIYGRFFKPLVLENPAEK